MATDLELFVGTGEEYLLSYKIEKCGDEKFMMKRATATHTHHAAIRCMDVSGKYLAVGGMDDRIVIIDLKLNREVEAIFMRTSANSILFTSDGSHLFAGSEDGKMTSIKVGSWKKENLWIRPHSGKAILIVYTHKSDEIALTLGKDETLVTWEIKRGRQTSKMDLKDLADTRVTYDNLALNLDGTVIALSGVKTVTILSLIAAEFYNELELESRVTSMFWIDDDNLLIGMENGSIEWNNIREEKHVKSLKSQYQNRTSNLIT